MSKIKVKEGEKYILHCRTHDVGSEVNEEFIAASDMTEEDLMIEAEEFFTNEKQPEWWFEIQ